MFFKVKACRSKAKGIRWHLLFIRWCLNILLTSSKTYDIISESGLIRLPSKRILQDYTHWLKLKPGFNADVVNYLRDEIEIEALPDWKKYMHYHHSM